MEESHGGEVTVQWTPHYGALCRREQRPAVFSPEDRSDRSATGSFAHSMWPDSTFLEGATRDSRFAVMRLA